MNYMHEKLKQHIGHKIDCVPYGDPSNPVDVCIECEDCGCVVISAEDYDEPEDAKVFYFDKTGAVTSKKKEREGGKIAFEAFLKLVRERAEQGVVLYDIGETFDEGGNGNPWSALVWAREGMDPDELIRQCDEDGDYRGEVRCFGPALELYTLRDIYEDWTLDGIESWPIHR